MGLYFVSIHSLLLRSIVAQVDPQTQAVKNFFAGHKVLISYRQGAPLRGIYFFLQVHFCKSGTYQSFGESRKANGINHEEVRHWSDQGTWVVAAERGQIGVRCVSSSGRVSFVPVRSWPSRDGDEVGGISVLPQGAAHCP